MLIGTYTEAMKMYVGDFLAKCGLKVDVVDMATEPRNDVDYIWEFSLEEYYRIAPQYLVLGIEVESSPKVCKHILSMLSHGAKKLSLSDYYKIIK